MNLLAMTSIEVRAYAQTLRPLSRGCEALRKSLKLGKNEKPGEGAQPSPEAL